MKKVTITEKILKRPVSVFMVSLMVIGFGLFSLSNLKVTLMPSFEIPVMAVSINYSNVAPEDINRLLVEPVEGAIMGVDGINSMDAYVRQGGAFIILRLKSGINIQRTELHVREAIDRIRNQLPMEASEPIIFQFDPERSPIMQISVESTLLGLDELRNLSIEFIEPRFERLHGVASADTRGGLERNFYINLDPAAMARHRVVPSQVVNALRNNNIKQPIGSIITDRISYNIRAESTFRNLDEIKQTVIYLSDEGVPVRVSDVAAVENTYADINSIVEVNGKNSVTVEIQKQSDANTLDVAQAVIVEMNNFKDNLPGSVSMQVLSNEGQFIEDSIKNLAQSALIALVVVVLILLLFMGGWRIAFVVAMSIPVSLTATFAIMYFFDISLNIISITGLALAIGLLVDNSIVVSESIANKLEEGKGKFQAALDGTNEVAGALLGSTLTTLAVFVPILGVTGITGAVTRDLALTISIAITSSFIASVVLIPVLASLIMKKEKFESGGVITFRGFRALEKNYGHILYWILQRKYTAALFVLMVIAGSYFLFREIPGEFFPETDAGEFTVRIDLPAGTQLSTTAETLREFSEEIGQLPEVRTVITNIGRQRRSTQSNLGEINVLLVDQREREKSTNDMIMDVRQMLQQPDIELDFRGSGGGPGGMRMGGRDWGERGIQITLIGPEIDVLQEISARIEDRLTGDPNIISVSNTRTRPTPEIQYVLDRERISRIGGVSSGEIAQSFGTQARGTRAGFYREEGREIPIQVRNVRDRFQNRGDLFALELLQVDDQRIPIVSMGQFNIEQGLSRFNKRDRETILDVMIMIRGNLEDYRETIQTLLTEEVVLPDGYRYDFTGTLRDQDESARELVLAALLALLLTYMVMASLFENLRDPFIIMFTVPLAFFGSLLFLFITGTALSVPAYIGIVILVGIVVNNGIVLVDYIHFYTREGGAYGKSYLIHFLRACKRRMRPILLTAMTTIFSMVPLALEFGVGAETWSPLAKSVIGGLAFATILTLFVVPAVVVGISKVRREWVQEGLDSLE